MCQCQPGCAQFRRRTQVSIGFILVPAKALTALLWLHRQVGAPDEQVGASQDSRNSSKQPWMGDNLFCPGGKDVRAEDFVPSDFSITPFPTSIALNIISVPVKNYVKGMRIEMVNDSTCDK